MSIHPSQTMCSPDRPRPALHLALPSLGRVSALAALAACAYLPAFGLPAPSETSTAPASLASTTKTDPNNETVELPTFTITAEKVARPAQDVPMAVVAVDKSIINNFKIFNVQDIQAITPSLDVSTVDPRNPIPSIRGITFNPDSGTTAAVDVYWNEIAVSASTGFRAMYDVGQIEVLKGPQGALRGRSSPGGAILIGTNKPDMKQFGGSIEQSFSDQSLVNTQAVLNVPIVKGKLAVRVAGLYDSNNAGDIHDVVTNKTNESHTRSYRATAEWKPFDKLDVTFVHQYLHQILYNYPQIEGSPIYSTTLPANVGPFDRISVSPGNALYDDTPTLDSLTMDLKLPGRHELTAILGYQNIKSHLSVEYTNLADIIPDYTNPQTLDVAAKTKTCEVRFASVRHEKWNYIFGVYYEHTNSTVNVKQVAARLWFDGPNPYVSSSPVPRAPDMEIPLNLTISGPNSYRGIFTTQTVNLTKKLRLEAGVRYQEIKADSVEKDPNLGIDSPTSRDEKPTTGSASLSYRFTKSLLGYVTAARSYRPGGEGFRTDAAELEKYLHYKPEKSNGLEVGIKSTWLNNRLQFNADLFYQKFKNYISQSGYVYADSNFDGVSDNVYGITFNGDAKTQGAELGLTVSLPHRVIVGVDASYADARWTNALSPANVTTAAGVPVFNTPGEQVSFISLNGQRLGNTPRLSVSSHIEWSAQVSSVELFTRALFSYKGNRVLVNVPNPDIGGYGTLDLFAGVRNPGGRWSLTVWAKNVFDHEIVISRGAVTNIGNWFSGYTSVNVTPARELGMTLHYAF